jgi:hypothetical protein
VAQALHDVPEDWRFERALAGLPEVRRPRAEHVAEMNRMLLARLVPGAEVIERLGRYERSLQRQMLQTMQQLLVLKGWRAERMEEGGRGKKEGQRVVVSVKGYERRGRNRRVDRAPLDAVRGDPGAGG